MSGRLRAVLARLGDRIAPPMSDDHAERRLRHVRSYSASGYVVVLDGLPAVVGEQLPTLWPPVGCVPFSTYDGCSMWDPYGDRPTPIFCPVHCPDCRASSHPGYVVPCVFHDTAAWIALERQAGL